MSFKQSFKENLEFKINIIINYDSHRFPEWPSIFQEDGVSCNQKPS